MKNYNSLPAEREKIRLEMVEANNKVSTLREQLKEIDLQLNKERYDRKLSFIGKCYRYNELGYFKINAINNDGDFICKEIITYRFVDSISERFNSVDSYKIHSEDEFILDPSLYCKDFYEIRSERYELILKLVLQKLA